VTNDGPYVTFTNVQTSTSIRVAVTNLATGPGGVNSTTVQMTVLADNDHDGMADIWEVQYGFNTNNAADGDLDFDGDGMLNRQEYGAGTDPTDPLSLLKLVRSATNAALLEFVAQTNRSYTLQSRTNLTAPAAWIGTTNISPGTSVRTVQVEVPYPPPDPTRFYRIITPAVP
jgi:hypothetical protein